MVSRAPRWRYRRTDCQKHQLKLVGSIESIKIDRVTQYAETDVGFLRRLTSEYGYAVKVVSDQLVFLILPRYAVRSRSGS